MFGTINIERIVVRNPGFELQKFSTKNYAELHLLKTF